MGADRECAISSPARWRSRNRVCDSQPRATRISVGISDHRYAGVRPATAARTRLSPRLASWRSNDLFARSRSNGDRLRRKRVNSARLLLDRGHPWVGVGRRRCANDQGWIRRRNSVAPRDVVSGWPIRDARHSRCRASTGAPCQLDSTSGESGQTFVPMDARGKCSIRPRRSLDWTPPPWSPSEHIGVARS